MTSVEVPTLEEAIKFTVEKHDGQFRKGTELPYIVHPMAVLSLLGYWEIKCPITLKGCLGHDVREECSDVSFHDCVKGYGEPSALIIEELSFFPVRGGPPDHIQKKAYMAADHWMGVMVESLVIKLADRCCNTRDFMETDPNYARKYWNKASDLIDVVLTRGEEITKRFGVATFAKMKYTKQRVEDELALFSPAVR